MSTRIALLFRETHVREPANLDLRSLRIVAGVRFLESSGWSAPHEAIVSTGIPLPIIPKHIWTRVRHRVLGTFNEAHTGDGTPATLGEVSCSFADEHAASVPITLHAILSERDDLPLVVTLQGTTAFRCDGSNRTAYLEFPS